MNANEISNALKIMSMHMGDKLEITFTDDLREQDYKGKTFIVQYSIDDHTVVVSDCNKINGYILDTTNKCSDRMRFIA